MKFLLYILNRDHKQICPGTKLWWCRKKKWCKKKQKLLAQMGQSYASEFGHLFLLQTCPHTHTSQPHEVLFGLYGRWISKNFISAYDVFAISEYVGVFLNIAYHGCAYFDIRYKVIFSVRLVERSSFPSSRLKRIQPTWFLRTLRQFVF